MTRALAILEWCYARLLFLYPRTFRAQFAAAMRLAFRDRCHHARRDGWFRVCRTAAAAFLDVTANGVLERFSSHAAPASAPANATSASSRPRPRGDLLMRDARVSARRLFHEPGFTTIVVVTLALGIGATTTIFSIVEGVLLRPLPYRDAGRLLTVWQWSKAKGIEEAPSPANFLDWREAAQRVNLAAAEPFSVDLSVGGETIALDTWRVSERFFETLGVAPMLGRAFRAAR